MMKKIIILIVFNILFSQDADRKRILPDVISRWTPKENAVIDRKYSDHTGNRIMNRFYNFGAIGDAGG